MDTINTDLLIVGGGINGCGVAADASGRGLSVVLCEKNDLASATSSASSKLIHGGLRYLEQYEFKLVRKALKEREVLIRKAPYLITPLEFVLPHNQLLRPAWMVQMGLFIYDHLAKRKTLPGSKRLKLRQCLQGRPLQDKYTTGFSYYDCWTNDARLTILNALAAKELGATILTRTRLVSAERKNKTWLAQLQTSDNQTISIQAKAIVNASGPWVSDTLQQLNSQSQAQVSLVQGSHIIVPRLYQGEHAYILQNDDQRVIFAIPYLQQFTLIGTTDVPYVGDPNDVTISAQEKTYLCDVINHYFSQSIHPDDILASYSGVRPLYDDHSGDASKITREYHLELDTPANQAPLLSIFGGKITTFRTLAEHVLTELHPYFKQMGPAWTENPPLPGGDYQNQSMDEFNITFSRNHPWLPADICQRYLQSYGSRAAMVTEGAHCLADLGKHFGAGLYQKEMDYMITHEWAQSVEDIIWRRSRLGYFLTDDEINHLRSHIRHEHID